MGSTATPQSILRHNNSALREPRLKLKTNGFTEPPNDAGRVLLLPTGGKLQNGDPELIEVSDEALHRYRLATHILTQNDRPIPSLDQMKEELKEPDDSAHVEKRIRKLKAQHLDDLQRLYAAHATEYHEETLHRYRSKDESLHLASSENNQDVIGAYQRLEYLYRETRNATSYELHWHDDIARMNHSYQQEMMYLRQKKKDLQQREDEERRREESQFPRNIVDWRTKPKSVQLRVATFLSIDRPKQEHMLGKYQWAWRQVKPLMDEYIDSEEFQAEIRSLLVENESKDPRARRN